MPSHSHPGVYIEEIPDGDHPIAGVTTSASAFVGNFSRGPMNRAVRITSYSAFEREFGGLRRDSEASYAIRQYYHNGGDVAWVVRVASGTPLRASRTFAGANKSAFTARASSEGRWGDRVQVGITPTAGSTDRFDLAVREVVDSAAGLQVVHSEAYASVSMTQDDARYVQRVLAASRLIDVSVDNPGELPVATGTGDVTNVASLNDPDSASFVGLAVSGGTAGDDGNPPDAAAIIGRPQPATGMQALGEIGPAVFNVLCIPDAARLHATSATSYRDVVTAGEDLCLAHRAFFVVDPPASVTTAAAMSGFASGGDLPRHRNAAVYWPRLEIPDPLDEGRLRNVGASGTIAGGIARTDAAHGVWKAPAGLEFGLRGASIATGVDDRGNDALNRIAVNVLRTFPSYGAVCWGSRTLDGADTRASDWKYVPVRRTALFIEQSLLHGLRWVVFEPNDEQLWARIRRGVGTFLQGLYQQGAFPGSAPGQAYFVRCDSSTTTQADIDQGIVNVEVGFAPQRPAEFVVIRVQQRVLQDRS